MASGMLQRVRRMQERRVQLTNALYTGADDSRIQLEIDYIDAVLDDMCKFVQWTGKRKEV